MKKSILKYFKAFALVGIMASLIAVTSCGDDDGTEPVDEVTDSILDIVNNTEGLDSLKKYLNVYPELTATLGSEGTFTFFAPNNDAFIGLLETPGFPARIESINPEIIKGVLAYHIVAGQAVATADFTTDTELNTLYTDATSETVQTIKFNADGTVLTGSSNKEISVVTGDIQATNGVVHITESVLIPVSVESTLSVLLGTLAGSVMLGTDFSILAEGITKADEGKAAEATIVGALASVTDLTVFAPTNATFEAAQITAASLTAEQWDAYIRNHIVIGQGGSTDDGVNTLGADDLTTGATYTTLSQGTLTFFNNTDAIPPNNGVGIYIDSNGDVDLADQTTYGNFDAEAALLDAVTISQGRIHVIAGILAPASPQ
ncbi:Fasciclin domain-containing protein [Ekhidna lutea]|uniref:Fasciclin domain-containing protein n=1 Tax=Ekhidna lutea TaxID=447679 RepID=A0A239L7K5_EKHLU|nr:fasciclin domain-containing protein [Ekhidna lutea]SNT26607.1 Fasciclin domain-containing protein [Ekhidna lutea]